MSGTIAPLPQYVFMAWCSVKKSTGRTLLYFTFLGCYKESTQIRGPLYHFISSIGYHCYLRNDRFSSFSAPTVNKKNALNGWLILVEKGQLQSRDGSVDIETRLRD
jgi:hypothetical protein